MLTTDEMKKIANEGIDIMNKAFGMNPHSIEFRSLWDDLTDCLEAIAADSDEKLADIRDSTSDGNLYKILLDRR